MRITKKVLSILFVVMLILGAAGSRPIFAQDSSKPDDNPANGSIQDKVKGLIQQMTLQEKIDMVHGISKPGYIGYVPENDRLGIPALTLTDGPAGVRQGGTTAFPASIALGAAWDRGLAQQYGTAIGEETLAKGQNDILGPTINILRLPQWGRSFETFGEDPYLTSQLGVPWIEGAQDAGVIATAKHYVANTQEYNRTSVSSEVSERALHEIYYPAFKAAVQKADVGSIMASYNKINGTYASENEHILNDVLKQDWGFDGFVVSDWGATHSTIPAANNGLDLEMPGGTYFDQPLKDAVKNGKVSEDRLNDMVTRILTPMYEEGLFDTIQPEGNLDHAKLARKVAEQGTVLLKNKDSLLPLNKDQLHSIAVIGPYAKDPKVAGGGSAHITPTYAVSPLEGIQKQVGKDVDVRFAQGINVDGKLPAVDSSVLTPSGGADGQHGLKAEYFNNMNLKGNPVLTRIDDQIQFDWGTGSPEDAVNNDEFSVRWTGTLKAPTSGTYTFSLTSDDGSRLYIDGKPIVDNWGDHASNTEKGTIKLDAGQSYDIKVEYYDNGQDASISLGWKEPRQDEETPIEKAAKVAGNSDVAVVVAADNRTEGADRDTLKLPFNQNELIKAVAKANPHTIVVLDTGGPVLMNEWINNVDGALEAWYPGQENGNALANILFGEVNPSGKLPVTFQKQAGDASTAKDYPGDGKTAEFSDGVFVGYRHFDKDHIKPLYAFGYGLSYTTFAYDHLKITPKAPKAQADKKVSFDVTNTGSRAGSEVAQLYMGIPETNVQEPPKQLKRFKKVYLKPGETKHVTFRLDDKALSYWDTDANQWVVQNGQYHVMVGSSSRDIRLQDSFSIKGAIGPRFTTVQAPNIIVPNTTVTVTTEFTNGGSVPAHHVEMHLQAPHAWSVKAVSNSLFHTVEAGKSVETKWSIEVPADTPPGSNDLQGKTVVHSKGGKDSISGTAISTVAYASLNTAFNNTAISDDKDPSEANYDGTGVSYSAQALADVGLTPGAKVSHNGFNFIWPDVATGQPDNVVAGGQAVKVSGSGDRLGFLGAAGFGVASGKGKVLYTDGTSQSFTLTFADWYSNKPTPSGELLATTSSWNHPANQSDHKVSVYFSAITLKQGKTVMAVKLPDISQGVGDGVTQMHIFSMAFK